MITCCLRAGSYRMARDAALAAVGGTMLLGAPMVSLAQASHSSPAVRANATTRGLVVRLHQRVVRVTIHNFKFVPTRLEVSPGTRVVWTNSDSDPHTVTGDKGGWGSQGLDTGDRYARAFRTAGTFTYHCAIHPFMHGTVVVK